MKGFLKIIGGVIIAIILIYNADIYSKEQIPIDWAEVESILNDENPARSQLRLEEFTANHSSVTITGKLKKYGTKPTVIVLSSDKMKNTTIFVFLNKKDVAKFDIGDTITVKGKFSVLAGDIFIGSSTNYAKLLSIS